MKKIGFAVAALLCGIQLANAQTQKGTQNLGLNLTYDHKNDVTTSVDPAITSKQTQKSSDFTVGPTYGYFICDGTELGATLTYNNTARTFLNEYTITNGSSGVATQKQDVKLYGASVYLRKYVLFNNKIGFRAGPYLGYSWGDNVSTTQNPASPVTETKNTDKVFTAGARLDLVFYPSNKLGLALNVLGIGYSNYTSKGATPTNFESKAFAVNFINQNLGLSLFYVIGKK